jgi:ADP-heptose:LPS heptosyltransferase
VRALLISLGGGIGDSFLATVVARALRERFAAVDMLAPPSHRPVLRGNPDIADVLESDDAGVLAQRGYAASVCTWATLPNAMLPVRARIPVRAGQARRLYSFLFNRRVTVRSELGDRRTHWTQILLDYARALECDTTDTQPRIALASADRAEADRLLKTARAGEPFAILHPTRGISTRAERWPSEPFARLANALVERYGLTLLVTGSAEDRPLIEKMFAEARTQTRDFAPRRAALVNAAGAISLRGFAALAERARFVVAMDSGPMHLAAAAGAPTVGIFALQSDEPDRWAPLGPKTAVVRPSYPCPPSHRKETCPDFACVRALEFARVFAALDGLTR